MNTTTIFYLFSALFPSAFSILVSGTWSPKNGESENFKIISRFGFQKTDPLRLDQTRGYIFGNISDFFEGNFSGPAAAALALVNFAHFRKIYQILKIGDEFSCQNSLSPLKKLAFDSKCNNRGEQDIFRRIPCPLGQLCPDEDQASNVFADFQFTYRIQDRSQARFWYLILFDCYLDDNCTWRKANFSRESIYRINLINGQPRSKNFFFFLDGSQLSIDEQYLPQIELFGLIFTSILLILTLKISTKSGRFLKSILILAICQHLCSLIHYFRLSTNGIGWPFLKFSADQILNHTVEYLLILLLILIAKGWKIQTLVVKRRLKTLTLISSLFSLHLTFTFWALLTLDFWLYTCIFDVWQGWAVLVVRLSATCWFFVELRSSVKLEKDEQKRTFLLHFGSGFLVWFVYLPILGAFSINISLINRLEIVDGLHHLANFVVCATLTHLFYPKSASRKFFLNSDQSGNDSLNFEDDLAIFDDDDDFRKSYCTTMEDLDHVTNVVDCSKK